MSKEWDIYEGICSECGHKGLIKEWSDDWNRAGTDFEGFITGSPHLDRNALPTTGSPSCPRCGAVGAVERGERLKSDLLSDDAVKIARLEAIRAALAR
jgi:ssDNA-binding Zn-finger/Zn-ribbon topoisomerase 1